MASTPFNNTNIKPSDVSLLDIVKSIKDGTEYETRWGNILNLFHGLIRPKINEVEIDFGSEPFIETGIFNVVNSDVTTASKIVVNKSIKSPSNGRSIDEVFVESFDVSARAKSGSFDLYIKSLNGSVNGKFIFNYII